MDPVRMSTPGGAVASVGENGFSLFNESLDAGLLEIGLRVCAGGKTLDVAYDAAEESDGAIVATGSAAGVLRCRTEVRPAGADNAVRVAHTLSNESRAPIQLDCVCSGQFAPDSAVRLAGVHMYDARYCHDDNVRTERFPYFQPEYPYVRQLPVEPVELGVCEDQPFPALYLTDRKYSLGIVIAAAEQERTIPVWRFRRAPGALKGGLFAEYAMIHEFPQASKVVIAPGEELRLDAAYYQILADTHPQDAFGDFIDDLAGRFEFRGPTTPLLDAGLYCSWNYGRFSEQHADKLLTTAKFMAENLPGVKYFLMDAGYQRPADVTGVNHAHLSGFYPDPRANVDAEKFPDGIRAYSDAVRELGLRPGIWWSPMVVRESDLAKEHPDWLLQDADGRPVEVGTCTYLDLSVPAARDWLDEVLGVVLGEWGMDALKMDFWSQGFEMRSGRLRAENATSIGTRTALFEIIRKHLPDDGGVFMTCVAVGMGNPFIARYADTYRNSQDIGQGVWPEQIRACEWSLPTLGLPGRTTFLANADGIGINDDCPDNENFVRLTWGYITQGMLEIDGYLERLDERWVRALRKMTDRGDRGHRCLCADENAFVGRPLPETLYVDFPEGSRTRSAGVRQSVALFNWTDEPRVVSVRRERLGHDGPVTVENFWTGDRETWDEEFLTLRLDARSTMLFDVME